MTIEEKGKKIIEDIKKEKGTNPVRIFKKMAEKEYKKGKKNTSQKKEKVIPSWFNSKIESNESEDNEEFKNFIEEFRKND